MLCTKLFVLFFYMMNIYRINIYYFSCILLLFFVCFLFFIYITRSQMSVYLQQYSYFCNSDENVNQDSMVLCFFHTL